MFKKHIICTSEYVSGLNIDCCGYKHITAKRSTIQISQCRQPDLMLTQISRQVLILVRSVYHFIKFNLVFCVRQSY